MTQDSPAEAAPAPPESKILKQLKGSSPVYPLEAREKGIQGQVWVKLLISETGTVETVEPISGEPVLFEAVKEALKKWKFEPYIKNGKPVKVSTKRSFDFFFTGKNRKDKNPACETDGPLQPGPDAPSDSAHPHGNGSE